MACSHRSSNWTNQPYRSRPLCAAHEHPLPTHCRCREFTWIFVCSIFLALFVAYGEARVAIRTGLVARRACRRQQRAPRGAAAARAGAAVPPDCCSKAYAQ
jgi:hypothetical protein